MGGAGSAVSEYVMQNRLKTDVLTLGLPDSFILQGSQEEMYAELGLDTDGIITAVTAYVGH
jgi:1-deoxy-D-xylulose-5-phosphate synthase